MKCWPWAIWPFKKNVMISCTPLKRRGTTILLVSHSIGAIWAVCNRSIFIDKGQVKVVGDSEKVVKAYENQNYKKRRIIHGGAGR